MSPAGVIVPTSLNLNVSILCGPQPQKFLKMLRMKYTFNQGEFRGGGGGGGDVPTSGIRRPADPKGLPLILFKKSIFGLPTLKFF